MDHIKEERTKTMEEKKQATLFSVDPQDFLGRHKEYARSLVDGDPRSPYVINTSVLKSPQSAVLVSHTPEKEFVFGLLKHAEYIEAWIKSPDKGFYSLDYEYWKGGKDRVRRSFNPDFFIVQSVSKLIELARKENQTEKLNKLRKLEEEGIEQIVRVVEIKSDEDENETIAAKEQAGKVHFEALSAKLTTANPGNFSAAARPYLNQHYTFDLLRPSGFSAWFREIF